MPRVLKWLVWGIGTILAVAILAGVAGYAVMLRTVSPPTGQIDIAALSSPVSVTRDKHGIAHIKAANRLDAAVALGFTHAQDRFWQMETLRMTGQGRLSEMFGEATVDIDKFLRTLGFLEQVEKSLTILKPESQAVLDAYAKGVNAYLDRKTGLLEPKLPPEFLILGHSPEKWKAVHSLLVLKIMSLQLSQNMGFETRRLSLAAQGLSPAEIDDLLPYHRDDSPPPLPDLRSIFELSKPVKTAGLKDRNLAQGIRKEWIEELGRFASNNWVVSGSNTRSGAPLLANDPHLSFGAPSLWYLAHLSWPDSDGGNHVEIGATIPAVPAVILGRNQKVGWGFTNAGADVQDLFIEQINPENSDQYLTPDGWASFEKKEEIIKLSDGSEVAFTRLSTRHGPVLPNKFRRLGEMLPKNHVAALQWTGLSDRDNSFDVISSLPGVSNLEEFADLIKGNISPMQAIVVADVEGNIGLFSPAAVPIRSVENVGGGRIPLQGWLAKNDWQGLVPPDQLETWVNPAKGALGTANSRFVENNSAPFLTFDWDEVFRHDRVLESMVGATQPHTIESMRAGQLDNFSPALLEIRDQVLPLIAPSADHSSILNKLRNWDGRMVSERPEPMMMVSLFRHLVTLVFDDDLEEAKEVAFAKPAGALLRVLNQGGARRWCDVKNTGPVEDCAQMVNRAFLLMVEELTEAQGLDPSQWRYGKSHTVYNEHRPFSRVWPLSKLFTIEKPASGGAYTLLRAKSSLQEDENPYRAVHGAGYRGIYDFSDLNKSLFIQSTGQSGNRFSNHYDDMAQYWVEGRYVPMTTNPDEYERDAMGVWNLRPAQ